MSFERDEHGYRRRPKTSQAKDDSQYTGGVQKELMTKRIRAGKRMYYFDVKSTKAGDDFFITITESVRRGEKGFEKHKVFLYKEDFGKFLTSLHELVDYIQDECLPDYAFKDIPTLAPDDPELEIATPKAESNS